MYLTTYDMILSEEAFFTETFLFHTITIDEGHRLKNENSSLSAALSRISCPFRLLLTGTPIQNSMHELSALLHYIVPDVIDACMFDTTCDRDTGVVDQRAVANARGLLESLMIRRVKAEVEKSLLPKKEYVLRVPLSALQRVWYQRVLTKASGATELVSASQLSAKVMQLQKICNHPKTVVLQFDRDRAAARRTAARAAGSEYIKVHGTELGAEAMEMEAELRALGGPSSLAAASGKLALLDRLLLRKKAEGSRVLLFSQYTLALDVLEEYCGQKFGRAGYLRLDGTTNRIDREMDVRSFNAAGSPVFIYLISTRAGGQGINLASADTVVLYDTCWNPQVDLQAEDRAHRIGQRKQVKVYRLISESTMEERILATARQKLFIDKLVIKDAGAVGRAGGAQHRAAVADEQDQTDDEQSVSELWATLCHGAAALLDPAKNGRMLAAEDYDAIIDGAVERTEDDATIAQAETADTIVGGADGAAMAGAAAMAVQAASATAATVTAAEVTKSKLVTNYDLSAYGKTRLLAIGMVGLQQLCQDRGIWNPTFGPSEAAAALLQWKSNRAQMAQAAVDLTGDTMNGLDRRGRKGRGIGAKRYAPPLGALEKKVGKQARKLRHDDDCFCCDDGGDLLQCDVCPRVYHLECIGLKTAPKGTWHCPWHLCWTCKRKSSSAGGKLFHCMTCPETFCFDCVPDRYVQKNDKKALALAASLESRGCRSIKNFLFFRCDNCVKDGKKQHSADASAHAKKKRANGLDGISTIPANRASLPVSPPDGAVDLGSPHDRVHAGRIQPINADVSVPPASTAPPQKRPHQTAFEASRRTEDDSEDDSDDVEKFGHQAEESDKKNVSDEDEGDSLDDELRAATERAERAATAAAAQIAAGPQPGDLDAIQRAIASWEAAKLQGAVRSNTRPQQQRLLMLMPASSDLYSKKVQYRPGQFRPGERRRRRVQEFEGEEDGFVPKNPFRRTIGVLVTREEQSSHQSRRHSDPARR
eukprot:SAG31_NODE_596_length_13674_cov_3.806409_11_plen_990_part_00